MEGINTIWQIFKYNKFEFELPLDISTHSMQRWNEGCRIKLQGNWLKGSNK